MGSATPSVLNSISVTTSHDANDVGVATLDSGPIGDRVSLTSFAVSLPDRVAGKGGSTATLVFAPSVAGFIEVSRQRVGGLRVQRLCTSILHEKIRGATQVIC
jgi:hypothetical protein